MDSYQNDVYRNREEEIVDDLLPEFGAKLTDEDDWITGLIADSYCHTWGLDDYEICEAQFSESDKINFEIDLQFNGEPNDEAPTIFDTIQAKVRGNAVEKDGVWEITEYKILDAEFDIDYDDSEYQDAVVSNVNYFETFIEEIARLRLLNSLDVNDNDALNTLQRQVFIGAITCLETYLLDALVNKVLSDETFLRSFISNYDFNGKKVEINKLFEFVDKAEELAKDEMVKVMYHNLAKVSQIYESVIGIGFPKYSEIAKIVSTRHDLVHRNGKTPEGKRVEIDATIVANVIDDVEAFITEIDGKLKKQLAPDLNEDDLNF